MRIVAFFSAIAVIILLLAGCGHEKSNNSQVVNLVQLGGVEYPEIPKSNIIQLEKSDFPKGESVLLSGYRLTWRSSFGK